METKILHYIAMKYFFLAVGLIMAKMTSPWTRLQKSLARTLDCNIFSVYSKYYIKNVVHTVNNLLSVLFSVHQIFYVISS